MWRLLGNHTPASALKRAISLVRGMGLARTLSMVMAAVDDKYVRSFDRRYRIKTSAYILLPNTSFAPSRLSDATQYGPVNGWALRKFLREIRLPRELHFVDLGCGLGRACILAAEYGFKRVTGVELAPEFCALARDNLARCRLPASSLSSVTIVQMDVLDFCEQTDADVFFMFRPFSEEFLSWVLQKLEARAKGRNKPLTVICSERMLVPMSYTRTVARHPDFRKTYEAGILGQAFYVYECGNSSSPLDPKAT